jgi:hypothetical protein
MSLATTNTGQLLYLQDCYISIGGVRIFMNNLPELSDQHDASYASETGVGRSMPTKTFSNSGDRKISWTAHFIAENEAKLLDNLRALRLIEAATYPRSLVSNLPYLPPPICKIKCGRLLGDYELCVVLESYSVKFPNDVPWSDIGYIPYQFDVDMSFNVVYDSGNLPGAERIITFGV